jgi:hypothetical protein
MDYQKKIKAIVKVLKKLSPEERAEIEGLMPNVEIRTWNEFLTTTRPNSPELRDAMTKSAATVFARSFESKTAVGFKRLEYRPAHKGKMATMRVEIDYVDGGSTPEQWFWVNLPVIKKVT